MGNPVITDRALGSCFSYIKRNDSTCQNTDARKKNDGNTGAQMVCFNTDTPISALRVIQR